MSEDRGAGKIWRDAGFYPYVGGSRFCGGIDLGDPESWPALAPPRTNSASAEAERATEGGVTKDFPCLTS